MVMDKISLIICCSYISNLSSAYMLALTETASSHEVTTLKEAIWMHYDRQTRLSVTLPVCLRSCKGFGGEYGFRMWSLTNASFRHRPRDTKCFNSSSTSNSLFSDLLIALMQLFMKLEAWSPSISGQISPSSNQLRRR